MDRAKTTVASCQNQSDYGNIDLFYEIRPNFSKIIPVLFLVRMASKPRPNKSFLLRLGSLPDEVKQAAKERTSPIKQPKIEIIHSKLRPIYPMPKLQKNCPRLDIKTGGSLICIKARKAKKMGSSPRSK